MSEKEKLMLKLKSLIMTNKLKQKQYQKQNGYSSEVGCLTKEACKIAMLFPKIKSLGITFGDLKFESS